MYAGGITKIEIEFLRGQIHQGWYHGSPVVAVLLIADIYGTPKGQDPVLLSAVVQAEK